METETRKCDLCDLIATHRVLHGPYILVGYFCEFHAEITVLALKDDIAKGYE